MKCYICNAESFQNRKGVVRDDPQLNILECLNCGLVALSSNKHIKKDFYINSGMHGDTIPTIDDWLKETFQDDSRRLKMIESLLPNKRLLDFGCGAGGFIKLAENLASEVTGIELEYRVRKYWRSKLNIVPNIEKISKQSFDIITAFHVIEHLQDPKNVLIKLASKLHKEGRLIIEVPNSEDALLTLYDSNAFQKFSYWSQHIYLYNSNSLSLLARKAGLRVLAIQNYQRYPISNHLYWLAKSIPGGHKSWAFLDTPELTRAYANSLAAIGKTDTLIVHLGHD